MPPSVEITHVDVDGEKYAQLCRAIGLKSTPRLRVRLEPDGRTKGTHSYEGITIVAGFADYSAARLVHLHKDLQRTLMHELRHRWQHENWTEKQWADDRRRPYAARECERDSNEFADKNLHRATGVFRVRRSSPNRLGRLSRAEQKVR